MEKNLRKAILGAFESAQMRKYLRGCFDRLASSDIIDILLAANMPLEKKAGIMERLSEEYPYPESLPEWWKDCSAKERDLFDYAPYARMLRDAVGNKEYKEAEGAVYLLKSCHKLELVDNVPFARFDAAVKGLVEMVGDDLDEHLQRYGEPSWSYYIEKWIPSGDGKMEQTFDYLVLGNGTVTCAAYADRFRLFHHFEDSFNLNLPLPFHQGDIVTLDSRPYAPLKHCVITDMGDNQDCCAVQCLYVEDEDRADNGKIHITALKHSSFFQELVPFSALYRAETYTGELPEEERFMKDLSRAIKELPVDEQRIADILFEMEHEKVPGEELAGELRKRFWA